MSPIIKSPGFEGQIPGTSGLRKKTKEFMKELYLHHFIQSIFNISSIKFQGSRLLVSGDGRYFNKIAIKIICEIAAENGISQILIGKGGLVSTPAASGIIRTYRGGDYISAAILLTASHNPGGPDGDVGVKLNDQTGGPAREGMTNEIASCSSNLKDIHHSSLPWIDINVLGTHVFKEGKFTIEVIDTVEDWLQMMYKIFDFNLISNLMKRPDFSFIFDGMNGVGGIYAHKLFGDVLGLPSSQLLGCTPLEDFGGEHPDPNLVYARRLAERMGVFKAVEDDDISIPVFGAAVDGDADRNMIVGRGIFVSPGDSVAVIASYAQQCIPYFSSGVIGVARSMPTSRALDGVAKRLGINMYETPVGWKYFVNLMDANKVSICGEESFGTGSNHIREKDGLWAVLCWLSILAYRNEGAVGGELVTVKQIMNEFWEEYGRNYYCRYDYEAVDAEKTKEMVTHLRSLVSSKVFSEEEYPKMSAYLKSHSFAFDEFEYTDPVDGSCARQQGIRLTFDGCDRIIWRISGTGSEGSTIRVYFEKYLNEKNNLNLNIEDAVDELTELSLELSRIAAFTGRTSPTVIT